MPEKSRKVSEYMKTEVVTVPKTAVMKEAIEIMITKKTNGLVVIDENNKVVGILSSWDIIQYVVPDYLEDDKHLASFEAGDLFGKRVTQLAEDSITKFMTSQVHSVHPDSSLMEAASTLSEFHIRQLPVIDNTGSLVGYLNRTDIKKAFAEVLGINNPT